MGHAQAASGFDRLPWLADEPRPRARRGARDLAAWALTAAVLIAGTSYWIGFNSREAEPQSETAPPSTTVPLPQAKAAPAQPEVRPTPAPEVRAAAEPEVRLNIPRQPRRASVAATARVSAPEPTAAAKRIAPTAGRAPAASPPRQAATGYGRSVQIGAFGSRLQAKRGWAYMARAYPGVQRLRAVVVETRNSKGRRFYRFQIATTSQAHSEVLCQRMQKIRFSCAVVGLPWNPKGVER